MNRLSSADKMIRKGMKGMKLSQEDIDECMYCINLEVQVKLERLWIRPEAEEEKNKYKPF